MSVGPARSPVQPDPRTDLRRMAEHIEAGHSGGAGTRLRQRRQHPHGGGLARAAGPSTPSTVPSRAARSTPASACVSPKRLVRPSASIALVMRSPLVGIDDAGQR